MRLAVAALVALFTIAGCSVIPAPGGTGPLVTVEARGGECPEGMCESLVTIERDGRVHRTKPSVAELTSISPEAVAAIESAIVATDFAALRAKPFTGECPTAFDGQELIYTFTAPSGPQRIASCEVEVDPSHPLFRATEAALTVAAQE